MARKSEGMDIAYSVCILGLLCVGMFATVLYFSEYYTPAVLGCGARTRV